jgi:hypothetical protein
LGQVVGDGVRAGVQALLGKLFAERDDVLFDPGWGRVRAAVRTPGAWLEPGLAVGVVAAHELVHPPARHRIVAGDLADRPPLQSDRSDHQPRHRHRAHLPIEVCTMSRDT